MGKGDKRTRKGKIFAGSYGKTRQKNKKSTTPTSGEETPAPKSRKKSE
jgi:30S ribosomal protein S31